MRYCRPTNAKPRPSSSREFFQVMDQVGFDSRSWNGLSSVTKSNKDGIFKLFVSPGRAWGPAYLVEIRHRPASPPTHRPDGHGEHIAAPAVRERLLPRTTVRGRSLTFSINTEWCPHGITQMNSPR